MWVQTTSKIVPTATFTGDALLKIVNRRLLNQRFGADTYPAGSAGQRLINLTLNGLGGYGSDEAGAKVALDAIQFVGKVHGVVARDISIYKFTGHAITTSPDRDQAETPAYLYSSPFERIAAKACSGVTYGFTNTTDSLFTDLLTVEGGTIGFFIVGCGNSVFIGCRAEWNAGNGFDLKGGNGIVELLGCSTDRTPPPAFRRSPQTLCASAPRSSPSDAPKARAGARWGLAGSGANGRYLIVIPGPELSRREPHRTEGQRNSDRKTGKQCARSTSPQCCSARSWSRRWRRPPRQAPRERLPSFTTGTAR